MITVVQEPSFEKFKQDVEPFLRRDVMGNIMGLRIMTGIADGKYPEFHLFKLIEDDQVVGAAIRTPPHHLFLSKAADDVMRALADHVKVTGYDFPGVNGLKTSTSVFAQAWNKNVSGLAPRLGLQYYVLDHITPFRNVPGAARLATVNDLDLLSDWAVEFAVEAGLSAHEQQRDPADIAKKINDRELLIWTVDHQPVSQAGYNPIIDGLINIRSVYTPPEFRRRGYGQACTAAVAKLILSRGARAVLCADTSNPTSNKIYQEIGFQPTVQYQEYRFVS